VSIDNPDIPAMNIPRIALIPPYGNPRKYPAKMLIVNVGTAINKITKQQ
jgi:hypothetical protein